MREFDDESAALAHQQELECRQQRVPATLAAAFVKAQAEIEKAAKDKSNPHFRSKYADLGNVIDAIKPALEKHGLSFFQKFHSSSNGVAIETLIIHESGEIMSNGVLVIPADRNNAHGFGSACTYARRYSLQAAFGVAPEDDDGNSAVNQKAAPKVDLKAEREQNLKSALAATSKAASEEELNAIYKRSLAIFGKDSKELNEVIAACTKRKDQLLTEAA